MLQFEQSARSSNSKKKKKKIHNYLKLLSIKPSLIHRMGKDLTITIRAIAVSQIKNKIISRIEFLKFHCYRPMILITHIGACVKDIAFIIINIVVVVVIVVRKIRRLKRDPYSRHKAQKDWARETLKYFNGKKRKY